MTYDRSQRACGALRASSAGDSVHFEISPNPAFVDEDVRVCVRGLTAAALISVQAATDDDQGRRWISQARFRADSGGGLTLRCTNLWTAAIVASRRWGFSGPWSLRRRARTVVPVSRKMIVRRIAWISRLCSMGA